ncbi:MAG: GDSL-type esterase/lipase family protein [Candidatus Cloacimonadaceae bacterium]|nr:GDSL-type esterase/lipase family protein [Candidatus Cloacimonadota bacterium]MDY0128038.1 GDSL-type esterase/lipase family protein [Candidatus Cloacimonadaceae bacterium]MCB5255019.1 GDSL-type esterase/lipase family protein [Candidatus Cloacimonadota bacterium]MCK9178022.1 GDSL-type esterase/lipase family protein [Candidatus Cloacimonadota bacterium]MCK9241886.1 GDSL-type esterase/lipase family protein [Candidatus Cloacimonadota bacterium]
MSHRHFLLILLLLASLALLLALNKSERQQSFLFTEDEYPEDLDTLEEFIQSYYLLLDSDSYIKEYSFIHPEFNLLTNETPALTEFYHKLLELRAGRRERVVIYQIGDSHIQSGFFSGTARSALQKYFGNAGRGLIFPHKLAGTNQPDDYQILSKARFGSISRPRSLSGYTLEIIRPATMRILPNSFFQIDSKFDRIKVFADHTAQFSKDSGFQKINPDNHPACSSHLLSFDQLIGEAEINLPDSMQRLYGFSLEREEKGLLYHSMGVNGAGFYNLANDQQFFQQIGILEPDLIIVSLGTNDAQGRYRDQVMKANLQLFMDNLISANPASALLFTLPPDSYKHGKLNPATSSIEANIREYATEHNLAWWELRAVMGGAGSINTWRQHKMAAKDFLHYTPKGYMLQGHLFYQSLIKGYKTYSENGELR